jgi:hypothetical protein
MTWSSGKLREPEARDLVLVIAANHPGHRASTTQIKDTAPKYRKMSPDDLKSSSTRTHEHMWEQIIGNVTGSHQDGNLSIFTKGLATRTEDGVEVTAAGIEYLRKKGLYV